MKRSLESDDFLVRAFQSTGGERTALEGQHLRAGVDHLDSTIGKI